MQRTRSSSKALWRRGFFLLAASLGLASCSDDGDVSSTCVDNTGRLDFAATMALADWNGGSAGAEYKVDGTNYQAGKAHDFVLAVSNTASPNRAKPLKILAVALVETDYDGKPVATPHFSCVGPGGAPCATAKWPEIIPSGFDAACAGAGATTSVPITLRYLRPGKTERRRVRLDLSVANDPAFKDKPRSVEVLLLDGTPKLTCGPTNIDYGQVKPGETRDKEFITCTSTGSAAVEVTKVEILSLAMPLRIEFLGQVVKVNIPFLGEPKIVLDQGQSLKLQLFLGASTSEAKLTATVRVHSSDAGSPQFNVPVVANATGPCLLIVPNKIKFEPAVAVGQTAQVEIQLKACGTLETVVDSVYIDPTSSPAFTYEFGSQCTAPATGKPLTIAVNTSCNVRVFFSPTQEGPTATGKLCATSNAGDPRCIDLAGDPGKPGAPVPCIKVKSLPVGLPGVTINSGGVTIPQTNLQFDASCSTAATGKVVTKWKWTSKQASGSFASFLPGAGSKTPKLQPNIAGKYEFYLEVWDDAGTPSTAPAKFELTVIPNDKLHIELTWDTPADKDNTDTGVDAKGKPVGSDLDLHLAHALATSQPGQMDFDKNGEPDPWNATCFDCFPLNPAPKPWGNSSDPADDPSLDLDDEDGWGPENINLTEPEMATPYQIGVYQFNDNGFGPSVPRVRIYLDAQAVPVFDKTGPSLAVADMWCVARVTWGGDVKKSQIEPCKGADTLGNLVSKKYPLPPVTKKLGCK